MHRFALISEGWTDVAVIENIVSGMYGNDAVVNPLMPLRDETDASRYSNQNFSNWELVLQYLATDQINLALATNDYLIIQIDTDMAERPEFGLNLTTNGEINSITQIIDDCKKNLQARLPNNLTREDQERIIFAIPVLTTECWLVGLHDKLHLHTQKQS